MKKGIALLLASAMTFALIGCGGAQAVQEPATEAAVEETVAETAEAPAAEEAPVASAEGVELNVTTTFAGEDGNAQNFKDAVNAWCEQTGNTVADTSATSDETFKTRVVTDFETGSEPDVLFFFNGADANSFIEAGKVVSIDDIRAEYPDYASNMNDELIADSLVDGKKYAVPVNGYWEAMFVNTEVLDAAGVAVPGANYSMDDFKADCQKIVDAGYTPIAASLQEIPHYWFEYAIYNFQSPETHNTVPESVDDEYGKAWVDGLNDIKALYEAGYFPENTLTATDAETFQLFTGDKAAFLIDGSWKIGGIAEAVDDIENFTVVNVPGKGDRKTTDEIGGLSMGYYITRKAWDDEEKRDAAVSFVSFMTSDEVVSKFAGVSATALKEGAAPDTSEFNPLQVDAIAYTAPAVQDNLSAAAREPIFADMASIVNGDVDAADAVAAVLEANAE